MSVISTIPRQAQMTLAFEPGLVERYPALMDCLRACVHGHDKPMKTIAADMDMSTSDLSRKLAGNPNDPRHFHVDDLERYVQATGDTTPIAYLAAKYLQDDDARRMQVVNQATRLLAELGPVLAALKQSA